MFKLLKRHGKLIKVTALSRLHREIQQPLRQRLDEVYGQDVHMEGKWMIACEEKLKELTGRKHVHMVTSGTSALMLMFMALGIDQGDRVICINHSIPSSVMPPKLLGADLIFSDINKHGQQDLTGIDKEDVKAIMTTGLYGDCHDHDLIADLGIPVINDSCQAFLSKYKGKEATSIGDASAISFAQNKTCPVFGTYGAVLTDRDDWADDFSHTRRCGYLSRNNVNLDHIGINAQPHADKCVQVYTSLEYVLKWQERRQQIADEYRDALKDTGILIRTSPDYSTTNNHKFVLFVDKNIEFMKKLADMGIESHLHYRYNFSKNKVLSNDTTKDFPMTDFFVNHAITIPSHPWLRKDEMSAVMDAVKKSISKKDLDLKI